jgi:hypothetical protein
VTAQDDWQHWCDRFGKIRNTMIPLFQGFAKAIKDIPGGSRRATDSTGTCPGHPDDRLLEPRERRSSS